MKSLLDWISERVRRSSMSQDEKYLSQATSLEDLERRQRLLTYGRAPHQTNYQYYHDIRNGGAF